jgi:pimeloyl-ACP methyl ester carboxylesterase
MLVERTTIDGREAVRLARDQPSNHETTMYVIRANDRMYTLGFESDSIPSRLPGWLDGVAATFRAIEPLPFPDRHAAAIDRRARRRVRARPAPRPRVRGSRRGCDRGPHHAAVLARRLAVDAAGYRCQRLESRRHGTGDGAIHPRNAELMAERLSNARLVLVPGGRHGMHREYRDEVLAAMRDFLRDHPMERTRAGGMEQRHPGG